MTNATIDAMARAHWDTERRPGDSSWDELAASPEGSVGARHVARLRAKMRAAVDALQAPDLTDIRDRAASIVAWRKQHRDGDMPAAEALERAGSDAEGILVMCNEAAANDPARALARLFAEWWKKQERALTYHTGVSIGFEEICKSGLFGSTPDKWDLTDLGRAALAIAEDGG